MYDLENQTIGWAEYNCEYNYILSQLFSGNRSFMLHGFIVLKDLMSSYWPGGGGGGGGQWGCEDEN